MRTRTKIMLSRTLSRSILVARRLLGRDRFTTVTRHGLRWRLDLAEGIDLSIYLFGGFERRVTEACSRLVGPGAVVVDVGANCGAHALPIARHVGPDGRVIAIEATAYALDRLHANLALNPRLGPTLRPVHAFLLEDNSASVPPKIFSSWPLDGRAEVDPRHGGQLMSTGAAGGRTLDSLLADLDDVPVDLVKIDTDGNEHEVLRGATNLLGERRPAIVLELAPYVYAGREESFDEVVERLRGHGYRLYRLDARTPLPPEGAALRHSIPYGTGINAVALAGDWQPTSPRP